MTAPTLDFAALSKVLYSAVLSDVLDSLGYTEQAMRPFVRPLGACCRIGASATGILLRLAVSRLTAFGLRDSVCVSFH